MLFAMDRSWWRRYIQDVRVNFRGDLLTSSEATHRAMRIPRVPTVRTLDGISPQRNSIVTGGNSGYCAVQVAMLYGAKRVLLLGYDMGHADGQTHWHGDHPQGLGNRGQFDKWIPRFNALGPLAAERGVEIINCSRATAITGIPRLPLEQALA